MKAMWSLVLAAFTAGACGALAVGSLFVWPATDRPRAADAVVVLSGDHGERLPEGLRLIETGVARTLVLDGQPDHQQAIDMCKGGQPFEVICLRPHPDTTRGEARAAARLAARRGWRRLVVVTSTTHVTRARMLFRRCFDGRLDVVGASAPFEGRAAGLRNITHEVLPAAHASTLGRGC